MQCIDDNSTGREEMQVRGHDMLETKIMMMIKINNNNNNNN